MTEVFDDEVFDDEAGEPEEVAPTHALGVFSRELAGRTVWFHNPSPTQLTALRRLHAVTSKQVAKANGGNVARLVFDFNNSCLTLIESMILDDDDVTFLRDEMLGGTVETEEILAVLWPSQDVPDDDAEPVEKPKKVLKPARVANARRSKR